MKFVYPEEGRFTCLQCGDCCRAWEIALSEEEVRRIGSLDWAAAGLSPIAEPSVRVSDSGVSFSVLARRPDGACVFLTEDDACALHRHFGEPAKPLMCRMYPFSFHRVGESVAVDLAFSCRSVGEQRGDPLALRRSEWLHLIEQGSGRQRVDEMPARLTKRFPLSGDLLWEIEHQLIELLSESEYPLLHRLWSAHQFARLALQGDPSTEAAARLRRAIRTSLPSQLDRAELPGAMDRTERAVVLQWFYLTLNPIPVGYLGSKTRDRKRLLETRDGQCGAMMEDRNVFVDNRPLDVSGDELRSVEPGVLSSPETEKGLERYLVAKVMGQRFLQAGTELVSLREAIPRWLLAYPTILFASRATAAGLGKSAVDAEDVLRAVRLVDRGFGRVSIKGLKKPQREAWQFVLEETDAPIAAAAELLSGGTA